MDESGEIQLMFHRDITGIRGTEGAKGEQVAEGEKVMELTNDAGGSMTAYKMMDKLADVGDWIGVEGELFYTHKGELTILVSTFTFLSKAIQPLGDKFHGIGESQERAYRQRYLDMIFNTDSLERMKLRSDFVRVLREFYRSQGFRELDTPILGNSASGAAATPFVTHHADMDQEMYLRIAPEIALKMATVGGLEKVFEIGKNFRNE
jgi:lysyl-tRNA synthetase class 2